MSNDNPSSSSRGVGFVGLLTILFVALKLMGYINWSWLWVLSPLWISFLLGLLCAALYVGMVVIEKRAERRARR